MNINEINPYIRVAMHSVLRPHLRIKRRVIFDYELIYIESGDFELFYYDKIYRVEAGDLIFIRPGISHEFIIGGAPVSQPHIHFDLFYAPDSEKVPVSFKDMDKFSDDERRMIRTDIFSEYPHEPFIRFGDKESFLRLFYSVISTSVHGLTKKGMLTELIDQMVSENFPGTLKTEDAHPITEQIKNYIDSGQGLALSLDDFALLFSYSKFHLDKCFKKTFGMGLIEYRNAKRMEYAHRLLENQTVTEVAEKVGYNSIYAFSRAYKHRFGVSPKRNSKNQ